VTVALFIFASSDANDDARKNAEAPAFARASVRQILSVRLRRGRRITTHEPTDET